MTKSIGRFRILRELGRGAQSVVYLCDDPHLQREVAIKTLHFSEADPRMNAYLLAEARTVSKLRHPNIVPIFEAGEQDGDPYLVFEFVDGDSLERLVRGKAMPPLRAAQTISAVLDALAEAHARGIVHRDLKPSNILVDARGVPRVMDFGIAVRVAESRPSKEEGLMGTPLYMAPEYVETRTVNERTDLFAIGLILLEMLTGRRVRQAGSVREILKRIVHEPIALPPGANIDERLADIVLKAVAHDPQLRFESAGQMREALEMYLHPPETSAVDGDKNQGTLDFLMRRMRLKSDFPVLSDSVSAINRLTHSDKESVNKLSNTILKDYALTAKLLRIVNSTFYRQSAGGGISTVSRAVIVLGFDAVRNIALTVLMFEHLQNKGNATQLKEAFLRANLSGLIGRDIGLRLLPREAEEVFICSMFQSLGRMLAQYYFPDEVEEVRKVMLQRNCGDDAAVIQVLGASFEELGIGIARSWGFPPSLVNCMRRLPGGQIRKPVTRDETLHMIAGFSNELCEIIADSAPEERQKAMRQVGSRFAAGIQIGDEQMQALLEKSLGELAQIAASLHVNLKQSPFARKVRAWSGDGTAVPVPTAVERTIAETGLDTYPAGTVLIEKPQDASASSGMPVVEALECDFEADESGGVADAGHAGDMGGLDDMDGVDAGGDASDAQATLAAGIQDISNSLVDDFSLNDVLRITLETMYRAIGFKRVLLCLRDVKTGRMMGRFGFGTDTSQIVKNFQFQLGMAPDVFCAATAKGVDLIISDVNDPKIAERIPAWYRQHVAAETFVLFPLMLKGAPVALIYCDKEKAGEIVISPRELSLLKTLRNQAVLAIKQAQAT